MYALKVILFVLLFVVTILRIDYSIDATCRFKERIFPFSI
jgi:hypothetical protein